MRELKLTAAGSSSPIADEIRNIVRFLLGRNINIDVAISSEISAAEKNRFYICAVTQEKKLSEIIPPNQLFVLDLHPTTKFFLDIAQIPKGTEVYVFNNLLPYTKLLADECAGVGITELLFHSVAYEEMSDDDVCDCLRKAHYIIGVDCLVGENVLFSEKYCSCLRADVNIIPGKRAASTSSAARLLVGIAGFYREKCSEQGTERENNLRRAQNEQQNREINDVIQVLTTAAEQIVTSQVVGTDTAFCNETTPGATWTSSEEQLSTLRRLEKTLQHLCG